MKFLNYPQTDKISCQIYRVFVAIRLFFHKSSFVNLKSSISTQCLCDILLLNTSAKECLCDIPLLNTSAKECLCDISLRDSLAKECLCDIPLLNTSAKECLCDIPLRDSLAKECLCDIGPKMSILTQCLCDISLRDSLAKKCLCDIGKKNVYATLAPGCVGEGAPACSPLPYSHSMVAGGLELMSYTTRFTPFTLLMMSFDTPARNSQGKCAQSAVIPSVEVTARRATVYS